MTHPLSSLPRFVVPVAGPKSLIGAIGLATQFSPADPFPYRCEFYGLLNGEGDSRRSCVALNYAEHELVVLDEPEGAENERP